jgi:hypothetical protein
MKNAQRNALVFCSVLGVAACWHRFSLRIGFSLGAESPRRNEQTVCRNFEKGKLGQDRHPLESALFLAKRRGIFTASDRFCRMARYVAAGDRNKHERTTKHWSISQTRERGLSRHNQASGDHDPAPTLIRKSRLITIAKSVLASLTMNQNPCSGRHNSGIFVVAIAVRITIRSGMLAILVNKPIKTRKPQAISNVPTRCAVKSGYGNPILVNRRTPI